MKNEFRRVLSALIALLIVFTVIPKGIVLADSSLSNEIQVYNYLVGRMGLNTAAACGLLANVKAESNFNPLGDGDAGTSYGLFQWHAGRKDNLISYCASKGLDYTTIDGQLQYLEYELKKSYAGVYNYIKSVSNTADGAYDAGYYWCYYYEIPANREVKAGRRGETARSVYWKKYEMYKGKTIKEAAEMQPDDYKVSYSRMLKESDPNIIGSDVLYLQLCLYALGYDIQADGCYGPVTAAAVKRFQSSHGLDPDGICGPITWDAIENELASVELKIILQPKSVTVETGDQVTFSTRATGSGLSYQWYHKKTGSSDWTKWEGKTTAAISATANESWNGMQVRCTVTDGRGKTVHSVAAVVTVNLPLAITQQPQFVDASIGDTVTFSVKASGNGMRYQWYFKKSGASDWSKWEGKTTATISATANESWNGMQVRCTVTDGSGNTLESESAVVAVNIPLAITQQPQSVTTGVGDTVTFSVKASGNRLRYQWYTRKTGASDWTKWAGHTTATTVATANESWNGMRVKCTVTDGSGNTLESESAVVTVNIPFAITQQPESVTANIGDSVRFTIKASGIDLRYQWYTRKTGASDWTKWTGHTTATTVANANESWNGMRVKCTVTDGSGNTIESESAVVTVNIPLAITRQPQSVTANIGDSVKFSVKASGTGLKYQWFFKKSGASDWTKWTGHVSATTTANANESWNGMRVRCTITDGSGNTLESESAVVTVNIPLAITQQPQSVTVNSGDPVKFSIKASGTGLKYQWYTRKSGASDWTKWTGHISATTTANANESWNGMQIRCIVTDGSGNTLESESAVVTVNIPLAITQQPQSVTVNSGDPVKFSIKASGTGLQYQWYTRKSGASDWTKWEGHTTAATDATANESWNGMRVRCAVTDSSGNKLESEAAVVTVNIPLAITQQPQSVTANIGDPVKFSVKANGNGLKYQWYTRKSGASDWTKWTGHISATTTATANESWNGMQVRCTVTDSRGNKVDSKVATVTMNLSLVITKHPQSVTAEICDTVTFSVKASGTGLSYQWYYKKSGDADWTKWNGHTTAVTLADANYSWNGMQVRCIVSDSQGNTAISQAATVTLVGDLNVVG